MIAGNNGDHTEQLRPNDTKNNPSDELVEKTESILTDTFQDDVEAPARSTRAEASDDKGDPNSDKEDLKANIPDRDDPNPDDTKDSDDGVTKDDGKVDNKDGVDEKANMLPYAYEQVALRNGWTQEDIDEAVAQNPERAKKMFGNLYNSVNQASRDFSALGRARAAQSVSKDNVQDTHIDDAQRSRDINLNKLREEFPDNPLVDVLDAVIKEVRANKVVSTSQDNTQVNESAQRVDAAEIYAFQQRIDNFFSSGQMLPYDQFYGKLEIGQDWNDLSSGQRDNRWRVINEADAIAGGYSAIGQVIEPEDALARAHLLVSEGVREQVIRSQIKGDVVKRNNSITLKPSDSKRTTQGEDKFGGDSKPKNRKELEAQVSQKLANVFGSQ